MTLRRFALILTAVYLASFFFAGVIIGIQMGLQP